MQISELSIRRPVLATVMNLLIVVSGAVCYFLLPVRELPDVENPVVSVTTIYPGASPQTVESTVTEPLERVLNGLEGIRTITSTSAFGMSAINLEFATGRDLDLASTDVSNAIQRGLGELPQEAERPVVAKAGANANAIMWISLRGESYSAVDRTDLVDRVARPSLQLLPGVAQVRIGGERRFAMRVWLDPAKMAAHGVDPTDVRRAIRENNLQVPAGQIEATTRRFTIDLDAQIDDPRVYERLVLRNDGGALVRLEDVGWVELGSENYQTVTRSTGEPTVGIGIVRQSRANELAVSKAVRDALPGIEEALPEDVRLDISTDQTIFVQASLRQVWETLAIVFALVVLVNFIFLRSLTTTLITAIAIPVSLVGTFAVMQVLGFSINVLTMLALVLAIGLLVDDSIVVMENVYRRQELGESALRAALRGSREVAFPVIATTAAVVAVLIPLSLMTGNTGRLFREFALSMATAVAISTFVALTLVPTLCSRFLRLKKEHGRLFLVIEGVLDATAGAYRGVLAWSIRHRVTMGLVLLATLAATLWLVRFIPTTLVPVEDRGQFMTFIRAPQGSTVAYTHQALDQVEESLKEIPEIAAFFSAISFGLGGPADSSSGLVFTRLKPWEERQVRQQDLVARLSSRFFTIPQALVFAINPSSLGQARQSDIHVVLKGSEVELAELEGSSQAIVGQMRQVPGLVNVDSDVRLDNPQLDVVIDREATADLGIPASQVAEALRLLVAQGPADEFVLRNKQYDVVLALASRYRSIPEQLGEIHVRAPNGAMVPLAGLVDLRATAGPATLNHHDLQRSVTFTANLLPEATLGETLPRVLDIVRRSLPRGFTVDLAGASREFVESSGAIYVTFAVALLVIYLVLAAQFESFIHPLTVMLSVPLASLGALVTLILTGNTLNLYSGIGMILLVGLVTKNSILLVDFANQERARGTELVAALRAAGRTRFRPILMTSMTSILGAVPLAWATGAGAESRQPIGAAVLGGLLFSTVFTLLVIPAVHMLIVRLAEVLGFNTIPPLVELERGESS